MNLCSQVSDVRLKCISALLPLYSQPHMAQKLELFTNKFKDRLVSMVMDKDCEVAMRACQLLTEIYRIYPAALLLKDCVPIYELVYCNHRGLAQAAGEFLNTKVSVQIFMVSSSFFGLSILAGISLGYHFIVITLNFAICSLHHALFFDAS